MTEVKHLTRLFVRLVTVYRLCTVGIFIAYPIQIMLYAAIRIDNEGLKKDIGSVWRTYSSTRPQ